MKQVRVIQHPLLKHKLGYLRDKNTYSHEFREIVKEVSKILIYEAMRDWKRLDQVAIETPIAKAMAERIVDPPVVVSIMRAGNGMLDAALSMIPFASTGFIGIYRDKFINNTVEYYFKMPHDVKGKDILLCDPLIATADTIIAAIDRLKSYGVGNIKVISILASQLGLERIEHFHPDVEVYTLNIESEINEVGYLVPGLGDAGDRLFQTK
ncbi:uracil phosphoribosyltransferase [Bdellovibrio sp. 22V]|uniref:uracil phosphoribosyltransferase n=1 Tax=Bdellovibrio TaxID=958 RepID=UPI00254394BD|nr:uracil phosphoribosyltransferase [Bdellovibrio sp. 22V]WII71527.1 uracil phosphoribosyltransferase [Bdellovibrio sp. 22V]